MWKTVGQDKAVGALSKSIAEDRLAHSYLIVGPPQVGKTTLALDIARAANCLSNNRPCSECRQCLRIDAELHPDVRIIELGLSAAGRPRTLISIEQVREAQQEAALLPYEGRFRVFVFERADKLSLEAANSLLKILEEPPESVMLILLVSDADAILPTIYSRCRRIDLRLVGAQTIIDFLRGRPDIALTEAQEIAGLALGRIGWAVRAADDPTILDAVAQTMDAIESAVSGSLADRFDYAEQLASRFSADREGALNELRMWLSWWRDAMLIHHERGDLAANVSRIESIRAFADRLERESILASINAVTKASFHLTSNVSPRLALESMMLEIPKV